MREKKKTVNQILVTERIIVTPDLKRKRKLYKFNFFLSTFLACVLFSICIYAEYDRNKSEQVSQDILLGIFDDTEEQDNTTISVEDDIIIVNALSEGVGRDGEEQVVSIADLLVGTQKTKITEFVASDGTTYYTESFLKIPSLGIEYPVLSDCTEELLKISLNRYWGPEPNETGNYVIAGHNYLSGKMFGKLPSIKIGDIIELTDLAGRMMQYKVYTTYVVEPTDTSCTSQHTNGKKEITLFTCVNGGKQRLIVKAEAFYEQD